MTVEIPQKGHRYGLKGKVLVRNVIITAFFWLFLGIPLLIIGAETSAFLQAEEPDPFIFILARLMVVILLLISLAFLMVNIAFILDFFSYIRVTSEGIEQRRSLRRYVKCKWSEIEKIDKSALRNDIILINPISATVQSARSSTSLGFLSPRQPFIVLTGYKGWPEGWPQR